MVSMALIAVAATARSAGWRRTILNGLGALISNSGIPAVIHHC
jgi:hypothetical protein